MTETFKGSPAYCEARALELLYQGFRVSKKIYLATGEVIYTMTKKG